MVKPWPIEIDGLPFLKMVIFHGYVSHNQRVWFIIVIELVAASEPKKLCSETQFVSTIVLFL